MGEIVGRRAVDAQELHDNLSAVLDGLRTGGHEVVITREGEPTAVLVDVERYAEVQQALQEFADPDYLVELLEARREIRSGDGVPAEEVFAQKGL